MLRNSRNQQWYWPVCELGNTTADVVKRPVSKMRVTLIHLSPDTTFSRNLLSPWHAIHTATEWGPSVFNAPHLLLYNVAFGVCQFQKSSCGTCDIIDAASLSFDVGSQSLGVVQLLTGFTGRPTWNVFRGVAQICFSFISTAAAHIFPFRFGFGCQLTNVNSVSTARAPVVRLKFETPKTSTGNGVRYSPYDCSVWGASPCGGVGRLHTEIRFGAFLTYKSGALLKYTRGLPQIRSEKWHSAFYNEVVTTSKSGRSFGRVFRIWFGASCQ